jgi:hypothetical protein
MAIGNIVKNSMIFGAKAFENKDAILELVRLNTLYSLFKHKKISVPEAVIKASLKNALDQYPGIEIENVICSTDKIRVDLLISKVFVKALAKISIKIVEGKLDKYNQTLVFEIADKNIISKNILSKIVSAVIVKMISFSIDIKLDSDSISQILVYDKHNKNIRAKIFEVPTIKEKNAVEILNFLAITFSHCENGILIAVNT